MWTTLDAVDTECRQGGESDKVLLRRGAAVLSVLNVSHTKPRLQDQDAVLKDKKHSFTLNRREALGNPGNSLKSGIILGYFLSHNFPLISEKKMYFCPYRLILETCM